MGFTPPAPPPVELYPTPVRSAYGRARHVLLCQAPSTRRRQCRRYAVGVVAGEPRCRVHKEVPVSRKKAPANGPVVHTQATHSLPDGTKLVVEGPDRYVLTMKRGRLCATEAADTEKRADDDLILCVGPADAIRACVAGLVALIGVGLPKPKRVRTRKAKEAAAA
jgi:hypothetical protein